MRVPRALLPILAVALSVAFALAEPPKIDGPSKVEPYKLVRVEAKNAGAEDAVMWKVRPLEEKNEGKVDAAGPGLNGPKIEWTAPPGRYRVELIVGRVTDGKLSLTGDERVITIGTPTTTPDPDPDTPPDQPADPPKPGKLYFVLARESGPITPAVRSAMVLPAWKEVAEAGHRMKAIPVDKLAKEYAAKVTTVPSVVVVRIDADGAGSTYVKTVPVPTTDAAVRELLK